MTVRNSSYQISPFVMTLVDVDVTNFVVGQPGAELIPQSLLDRAVTQTLSENIDPFIYQYGPARGPFPARAELVKFLISSNRYPQNITASSLIMTYGNSHAIGVAVQSLTEPGDTILVEEPTYFLAGKIFQDCRVQIHACGVDPSTGLDVSHLESMVKTLRPRLVYVNPIHHNPTGTSMPIHARDRLIQLSNEYGFIIVSDEPYVMLTFSDTVREEECSLGVTAERLFPDFKNLICCGSFSKMLAPGLRCGWMSGNPCVIDEISRNGALNSGGGPSSIITESITNLIKSGEFQRHLAYVRQCLESRLAALCESLESEFETDDIEYHKPSGGYFVFLRFRDSSIDSVDLSNFLSEKGYPVKCLPGPLCVALKRDAHVTQGLRLAFSFYTPEEIRRGIRVLASGYRAYRS